MARVHLGEDPAGARAASREIPTVAEFAKQFLEEAASPPSIKPHTKRLYASNLRRLVVPTIGSFKLDAVTSRDIARLHRRIGKATPTSANNMLVTLSSMYRYAGEVGVVTKGFNPARNAVTRHKTEKKERFLTIEEIGRLADTLRDVEQHGLNWKLMRREPSTGRSQNANRSRCLLLSLLQSGFCFSLVAVEAKS